MVFPTQQGAVILNYLVYILRGTRREALGGQKQKEIIDKPPTINLISADYATVFDITLCPAVNDSHVWLLHTNYNTLREMQFRSLSQKHKESLPPEEKHS